MEQVKLYATYLTTKKLCDSILDEDDFKVVNRLQVEMQNDSACTNILSDENRVIDLVKPIFEVLLPSGRIDRTAAFKLCPYLKGQLTKFTLTRNGVFKMDIPQSEASSSAPSQRSSSFERPDVVVRGAADIIPFTDSVDSFGRLTMSFAQSGLPPEKWSSLMYGL